MERQRIVYIDVAKGLAIFLVVLQHHELPAVLLDWVNSFLMVLFFVLSGYFWHLRPIKDEVKNGLRFLIMPLSDNNNRMGDISRTLFNIK